MDVAITRTGAGTAEAEGQTDAGIAFVDYWQCHGLTAIDAGRVSFSWFYVGQFQGEAGAAGLTVERVG